MWKANLHGIFLKRLTADRTFYLQMLNELYHSSIFSDSHNQLNPEYHTAQPPLGFNLSARKGIFGGVKQLYFPTLGDH